MRTITLTVREAYCHFIMRNKRDTGHLSVGLDPSETMSVEIDIHGMAGL